MLLGVVGVVWWINARTAPEPVADRPARETVVLPKLATPRSPAVVVPPVRDPLPGQGRAVAAASEAAGRCRQRARDQRVDG